MLNSFSLTKMAACLLVAVGIASALGAGSSLESTGQWNPKDGTPALVPWPTSLVMHQGVLTLGANCRIVASDEKLLPLAKILAEEIDLAGGHQLQTATGTARSGDIQLVIAPKFHNEAYELNVTDSVRIAGADYNAVAMGTVTLLQSLKNDSTALTVPHMLVNDAPPLKYRGAMLDVARKPHSIETLKACVEALRMYKVRYFQLHMTDENAWTFPSEAFPELGSQNFAWAGGEKPTVYKVQDLKALVAFADARGVTIVPELEFAGHSGQLRGSMPDVFGFKDAQGKIFPAGVINPANPKAYKVIDTLVAEAADIFKSSPYIHVGCDEASFGGTEVDPDMKALMAREKLADGNAVFNYHLGRLDAILKTHGKQMIVWEGAPLDPVLPPKDIIYMPWVGASGFAATLVKDGYDIINAPWGVKKAYMDPYEVNGAQLEHGEPKLIGATAISWQATQDQAVPFMRYNAALRNEPTHNPNSNKNLDDFIERQAVTDALLDRTLHGFTFRPQGQLSPLVFDRLDPMFANTDTLTLETHLKSGTVHYTLDGSDPTAQSPAYTKPIVLKASTTVRAQWFGNGDAPFLYPYSRTFRKITQIEHEAIGAAVTYTPAEPGYPGPGPKGLTDGILAPGDNYLDPGFVGWTAAPVQITLDLGKAKMIHMVSPRSVRSDGGLTPPAQVEVQLSNDGKDFHTVGTVSQADGIHNHGWYTVNLKEPESARYVRLNLTQAGDWIFIDEVVVNGKLPGPNFPHEAMGKKITFAPPPKEPYNWGGPDAAVDGYVTPTASFAQLEWLGWENTNMDATIDMGKPTELHEVGGRFLQHVWAGVFPPEHLRISVSDDGENFKEVADVKTPHDNAAAKIETISAKLKNVKARYVKINANTNGMWLFTDELFVNPH